MWICKGKTINILTIFGSPSKKERMPPLIFRLGRPEGGGSSDVNSPDSSGQPALWKRLSVSVCLNQTNSGWNSDWNKYGALPQKYFRSNFSAEAFPHHVVIQPQDPLESSTGTSFSFRISSGLLVVSTNGINGNPALCQ